MSDNTQESIWNDPNLLAMLFGQAAQAFSAPYAPSWQGGIGKMASGLGQSFKMAQALESQQAQEKAIWDRILKIFGGGEQMTRVPETSELATPQERTKAGFPSYAGRLLGGY